MEATPEPAPNEPPRLDLGRTLACAVVACGAWLLHAGTIAEEPRKTLSTLLLAIAVTTVLPVVMAIFLTLVAAVPLVILSPFALVAAAQKRPLGLGAVYRGMAEPGFKLVPGYIDAWRRAASPIAIGGLAGSLLAVPLVFALAAASRG